MSNTCWVLLHQPPGSADTHVHAVYSTREKAVGGLHPDLVNPKDYDGTTDAWWVIEVQAYGLEKA